MYKKFITREFLQPKQTIVKMVKMMNCLMMEKVNFECGESVMEERVSNACESGDEGDELA